MCPVHFDSMRAWFSEEAVKNRCEDQREILFPVGLRESHDSDIVSAPPIVQIFKMAAHVSYG